MYSTSANNTPRNSGSPKISRIVPLMSLPGNWAILGQLLVSLMPGFTGISIMLEK